MKDEGVSRQQLASSPFYRYEFGLSMEKVDVLKTCPKNRKSG